MEPFRTFKEPNEAEHLAYWLTDQGITALMKEVPPMANVLFLATKFTNDYQVLIPAADFTRAEALLEAYYTQQLETLDKDYYLFSFTDAELTEIIADRDKWGELDYILAKKLLRQRGHEISDQQLNDFKKSRMEQLALPGRKGTWPLVVGYTILVAAAWFSIRIQVIAVVAFLLSTCGLIGGLFIGWHLSNAAETMPDGSRAFTYAPQDRIRGRWLMYLGGIWLLIAIGMFIFSGYITAGTP